MNGLAISTENLPPPEHLSGSQCSICLENLDSNKRSVTTTECHHTFDNDCLFEWLTHKPSCPLCCKRLSDRSACEASQAVVSETPMCAICQECLNEPVSITRCLHRFHSECLSRWVRDKSDPFCPLCRSPMPESRVPESQPYPDFLVERRVPLLTECSICSQSLSGRVATQTPCEHEFHSECLSTWLRSPEGSSSCPDCQTFLPQRVSLKSLHFRNYSWHAGALDVLATPVMAGDGALFRNTHCQICQRPFESPEWLLRTVCDHDFHMYCLQNVFTRNQSRKSHPLQRLFFRNPAPRSYSCPYCLTPLIVPARPPVARDSTHDSSQEAAIRRELSDSESLLVAAIRRELSDSESLLVADTNAAGMGFMADGITESDDNEEDSNDGLLNGFAQRAVQRTGWTLDSHCQIL